MKLVETRTSLDDEFEDCLDRFYSELFDINQKAVAQENETGQVDTVKKQTCYLLEFIDCNIIRMKEKHKAKVSKK